MLTCPICQESCQIQRIFNCNHSVCYMCFRKLIHSSNKCPLCRNEIYNNEKYEWLISNTTTHDELLQLAIMDNDEKLVKKALDEGARLSVPYDADKDPIRLVTAQDNVNIFQMLLQMGVDPFQDDHILFVVAAENNSIEIVKYLLKLNINVFTRDFVGLQIAMGKGYSDLANIILDYVIEKRYPTKITPEVQIFYNDALNAAIVLENCASIELLLKKPGIEYNSKDWLFETVSAGYSPEIVDLLLNNGVQPFAENLDQLLIESAECNNIRCVNLALKDGANINYSNPNDETALTVSIVHGNFEITKILIKHNADPTEVFYYCFETMNTTLLGYIMECGAKADAGTLLELRRRRDELSKMYTMVLTRKMIPMRKCKSRSIENREPFRI